MQGSAHEVQRKRDQIRAELRKSLAAKLEQATGLARTAARWDGVTDYAKLASVLTEALQLSKDLRAGAKNI